MDSSEIHLYLTKTHADSQRCSVRMYGDAYARVREVGPKYVRAHS